MEIRYYDNLPEEAKTIRRAVFMEEQGFQEEFDEIDGQAGHLVMFDGALPVATCRFYRKKGTVSYIIGRVAVIPEYRGRSLGSGLLQAVEDIVKKKQADAVWLHAQVRAQAFYQKQGYFPYGETDDEEGCPHIWMCKKISENLKNQKK